MYSTLTRGDSLMNSTASSWPLTYSPQLASLHLLHVANQVPHLVLLLACQKVTSPPQLRGVKLVAQSRRTALSAARGEGEEERQLHTSVGSAIYPCMWYHVLNFTTLRGTHRGTFLTLEKCEVQIMVQYTCVGCTPIENIFTVCVCTCVYVAHTLYQPSIG